MLVCLISAEAHKVKYNIKIETYLIIFRIICGRTKMQIRINDHLQGKAI